MADEEVQQQESAPAEAATTDSLVDSMLQDFETKKGDLAQDVQDAVSEAGRSMIQYFSERLQGVKMDRKFFDAALDELDKKISSQLDEVLHHKDFQKLESAWMGLWWFIDRTDFKQNIRVDLLNVSKDDLRQDFEEAVGDITTTGLYQKIYTAEYGMPNGKPYGGMILNYEFNHKAPDMALMMKVAEIANMAHAPVITAVAPEFFGPKGFEHLTDARYDVEEALAGAEYVKWHGFRDDENSRYVGLTMPRFLLRTPYNESDNPTDAKEFRYSENIDGKHENYCWGNSAFTFANRLTDAFSKYKWCWRILGEESGGAVNDLKVHVYEENGQQIQKPPTEFGISFRKENELTTAGFVPLLWHKEKDMSVFYRAPSAKKPLSYPDTEEGRKNERNDKLRMRLPYIFILTRFAHYLKRLQTKYIGKPTTKAALEQELNEWIRQYVNATSSPQSGTLGKHPLQAAQITVTEDEKNPGVYLCDVKITPHTLTESMTTTLSLVSKTDLQQG